MQRKPESYQGEADSLPGTKIYINIKHLEKGKYELNIMNHNTIIKKTTFKKK